MRRAAAIFAIIMLAANSTLWINGYIPEDNLPSIWNFLPEGLQSTTPSSDFMDNLILTNTEGIEVTEQGTESFVTNSVNFIKQIVGLLQAIFTLIDVVVKLLSFAIIGLAIILSTAGVPGNYVVLGAIINIGIVAFGLLEWLLDFTAASRGLTSV
ncbi:hypothetical protein LCGC14_1280410 [marine sediment metagenome]|uniref:Uncharacterized protein n=1 Tax=marine sediment metagenome TaxID=412755 RepID=A0A0F9KVC5_9ZZZZ